MDLTQFRKFASPRWKIVTPGPLKYVVHLRSFAPWAWLGPFRGHEGDNRTFSTREDVTSRIRMEFVYSLKDKNLVFQHVESDWSVGVKAIGMFPTGMGAMKGVPMGSARRSKSDGSWTEIRCSYAGSLPLVKGAADVNVDATFRFGEVLAPGKARLGIQVKITGDDFPFFESFIRDAKGQRLFLCVSKPHDPRLSGQWLGPLLAPPGNFRRFMASADLAIGVDEQGNFTGVDDRVVDLAKRDTWKRPDNPKFVSVQTWNEYFTTREWL